jgi:inner membrane protein
MLIAHLPAGYLLGLGLQKLSLRLDRKLLLAAIIGSLAPDFDMIYFHLVDGRQTHHHEYFTHWPLFWVGLLALMLFFTKVASPSRAFSVLAFGSGAILHMVLDTIASPIHWLMPFSPQAFEMVVVPATYQNWIWSFVLHWTFLLEISIWVLSIALFSRNRHWAKNGA